MTNLCWYIGADLLHNVTNRNVDEQADELVIHNCKI